MIVVISGLPRSGTSMMMNMIRAGGLEVLTDDVRKADNDNLRGYLEYERVKQLDKDASWIVEAEGKVVKVISVLLRYLPPDHEYKIIFMHRDILEILASQKKMLEHRGEQPSDVSDDTMSAVYKKHILEIKEWLKKQSNVETLHINYNEALVNIRPTVVRVNEFLGGGLNMEEMVNVVDPLLYRQRK